MNAQAHVRWSLRPQILEQCLPAAFTSHSQLSENPTAVDSSLVQRETSSMHSMMLTMYSFDVFLGLASQY